MLTKLLEKPNLVIVPVGSPVDKFVKQVNHPMPIENHWRWTKNDRNYSILAVQYGDFEPEEGAYDALLKISGFKWTIAKELQKHLDYTDWEYVGFYDDDVILDYSAMNYSFDLAASKEFKAFQISLSPGSESQYPCTRYNPSLKYSYTNFIEIMCPVFHKSVINKAMRLAHSYDIFCGWGFDYVMAEYLDIKPAIIHEVHMFHPPRPDTGSGYDKTKAFNEMYNLFDNVFPKLMSEEGRTVKNNYHAFRPDEIQMVMNI
jgi:hypothetical protein